MPVLTPELAATLLREMAQLSAAVKALATAVTDLSQRRLLNPHPERQPGVEKLMELQEVAEVAGTSTKTIRREVESGRMRAIRVGNRYRFRMVDLREWMETRSTTRISRKRWT